MNARQPAAVLRMRIIRAIPLYLLMIPGLLYLLVNNYVPMAGLIIAFKSLDFRLGILASPWVGLDNFKYLFASSDAWKITFNTLSYNAVFIVVNVGISVFVAILLADLTARRAVRFYQSAILLPYLISMIIISYLGNAFMNNEIGFINKVVLPMIGHEKIMFYSDPKVWPVILVFINAWKNIGYLCIVFLSSILGIDDAYFEAASLEGATKLQNIRYITIPMITPVIVMMVLLFIGRIFYSDFGLFYHVPMNSGALYSTTNVIDTYVYRALLKLNDISMSSAAGLYQSIVGFVLVLCSNLVVRRLSPDNALF